MNIHPVVIGLANALLPGLGYLALPRRRIFGALILFSAAIGVVWGFVEVANPIIQATTDAWFVSETERGLWLEIAAWVTAACAFGYDAYKEAKRPA